MEKCIIVRKWNIYERFFLYGLVGFAAEICFTASWEAIEFGNRKLIGVSSMWIFFVYGMTILIFERLYLKLAETLPIYFRAIIYVLVTYAWEFSSGYALNRWDACPWDYRSYFRYHFMGLITFEYIPVWYLASILCETFVIRNALVAAWVKDVEIKEE